MISLLCETAARARRWWRGWYWAWPWDYIDGPIYFSIGLGFWSLWWSVPIYCLDCRGYHRHLSIDWNID